MKSSKYLVVLLCCFTQAFAADSLITPMKAKVKAPTKVLVLGTSHLRRVKQPLPFNALSPVNSKLQKFSPSAIAVEVLRPADIATMELNADSYQSVLSQFVGDKFLTLSERICKQLNVSNIQANQDLKELLSKKQFTLAWHKQVILYAIAARNKATALLHYGYLQVQEQDGALPEDVEQLLSHFFLKNNEIKLIAINLAITNKLTELLPIDDHLDKDQYQQHMAALRPGLKQSKYFSTLAKSDYVQKPMQLMQSATTTGDWLPLYQWLNSKTFQQQVLHVEWRGFIDEDTPIKPSLARIALWEIRNLNMISNIMRVVADNIGGNVLVMVGANHKVFFEAYLQNMIGVELIDFNEL